MQVKFHYDRKHQFFFMKKKNDFAFIQLHHDYKIVIINIINKKYNEQFVNSFKILKKIDRLIYRLNLSSHWRIYLVFNVAQLKSYFFFTKIFFRRHRTNNSNFVFVENNTTTIKFFEIKRFINKHQIKKRESKYLMRWKNCDLEYDVWRNFSKLNNTIKLVNEYEKIIRHVVIVFDRLLIKNTSIKHVKFIKKSFANNNFIVLIDRFFVFISSKFSKSNIVVISFRNKILTSSIDRFLAFILKKFFDVVVARATSSRKQKFVVIVLRKSLTNVFVVIQKTFINSSTFIDFSFVRRSRRLLSSL